MKVKTKQRKAKEKTYDYCTDFTVLSPIERRVILMTAKTLLKQQQKNNALFANVFLQR
jgi:hypothetical protein